MSQAKLLQEMDLPDVLNQSPASYPSFSHQKKPKPTLVQSAPIQSPPNIPPNVSDIPKPSAILANIIPEPFKTKTGSTNKYLIVFAILLTIFFIINVIIIINPLALTSNGIRVVGFVNLILVLVMIKTGRRSMDDDW